MISSNYRFGIPTFETQATPVCDFLVNECSILIVREFLREDCLALIGSVIVRLFLLPLRML